MGYPEIDISIQLPVWLRPAQKLGKLRIKQGALFQTWRSAPICMFRRSGTTSKRCAAISRSGNLKITAEFLEGTVEIGEFDTAPGEPAAYLSTADRGNLRSDPLRRLSLRARPTGELTSSRRVVISFYISGLLPYQIEPDGLQ